jgi:hypothetical protein
MELWQWNSVKNPPETKVSNKDGWSVGGWRRWCTSTRQRFAWVSSRRKGREKRRAKSAETLPTDKTGAKRRNMPRRRRIRGQRQRLFLGTKRLGMCREKEVRDDLHSRISRVCPTTPTKLRHTHERERDRERHTERETDREEKERKRERKRDKRGVKIL